VDVTVEVGIAIRGAERTSRLFFEWYDGRPTVSDFFKDSMSTLSLGLKIDL
jgi:hypothetical protein